MDIAISLFLFYLIFVVGATLTTEQFSQLNQRAFAILAVTIGQVLLLPLLAIIIINSLSSPSLAVYGLLLLAVCPAGSISNVYSLFAKADVALSVTLTTLSNLLACIVLPTLILYVLPNAIDHEIIKQSTFTYQIKQIGLILVLPLLIGMSIRHFLSAEIKLMMPYLERFAACALIVLLSAIVIKFKLFINQQFLPLAGYALTFTLLSALIGWSIAKSFRFTENQIAAIVIEYPARNLALTSLIASKIYQEPTFIAFAAVIFVVQTPLALSYVIWRRYFATNRHIITR